MSSPASAVASFPMPPVLANPTIAERLIAVVEQLSHKHGLQDIMDVVRLAARDLTGADGATFVLRDGDCCYYAEENAIAPLWKGQRFPMSICISGWVMLNGEAAVIEDIYADKRIPVEAYRPTFVKSLIMVPIRKQQPVGAIGNYWASQRVHTAEEVAILQALATAASVAMENADLYRQLQVQIQNLTRSNEELDRFAWAAAHDLRSPVQAMDHLASWISEDCGAALDDENRVRLATIQKRAQKLGRMLDGMLSYAQVSYSDESKSPHDMMSGEELLDNLPMAIEIPAGFRVEITDRFRSATFPAMPLERIFKNLVENSIRHHDRQAGTIKLDVELDQSTYRFMVNDDGPGIRPEFRAKIFDLFSAEKRDDQKATDGIGLAMVRKTLRCHGQDITVSCGAERGTTFSFTWVRPLTGEKA